MAKPLINILIRTTGKRPSLINTLKSISEQTYTNYRVVIGSEYPGLYTPCDKLIYLTPNTSKGKYFYNLYCNILKREVTKGYFFFLDDDDVLIDKDALHRIVPHLKGDGVICMMLRGKRTLKPTVSQMDNKSICSGHVGMPCLILHHSKKNLVNIQPVSNAFYLWIKEVRRKLVPTFVKSVLVHSPKRSYGK